MSVAALDAFHQIGMVLLLKRVDQIDGGLIRGKQDVIQALQAGVTAVSSSSPQVWRL